MMAAMESANRKSVGRLVSEMEGSATFAVS